MVRAKTIEIFSPTAGIKSDLPSTIAEPRGQSDANDAKLYFGVNQKEFGTTPYMTGLNNAAGAPINFIFEAKFPGSSILQVLTHTNVFRYATGIDSYTNDGQTFTGTFGDFWSGVMYDDQFFYTNGIDPIQFKADAASTGTNMNSAITTATYKAWAIAGLQDHLNIYHTIENGTEHYKRVRWTKKGTLSPTATDDFASGTAGAIDLNDAEGEIKTAVPLGGTISVFCERSIMTQMWVGGSEVYRFPKSVSGIGTPSRRGAVTYKDINYFIGNDNFYSYYGGNDVRDIGDPIRKIAFNQINNSAISNAFVEVNDIDEEILFHVPTTGELPDTTWVFNVAEGSWSKLTRDYTAAGRYTRRTGLTIGELIGIIGAQNFTFGDAFARSESLVRLYGDQSGRLVKVDKGVYSIVNSGTTAAQTFLFESPDFTSATETDPVDKDIVDFTSHEKRWVQCRIDMEGQGSAAVFYSTDEGQTFIEFDDSPITLINAGTSHILDMDDSSTSVRLRVTNTGTSEYVGITYYSFDFIVGAPY